MVVVVAVAPVVPLHSRVAPRIELVKLSENAQVPVAVRPHPLKVRHFQTRGTPFASF